MPNSHVQAYWHLVWGVKYRQYLISEAYREEVQRIITKLFEEFGQEVIRIYAMPDHVHILIKYDYTTLLPKVINKVKSNSSRMNKAIGIEEFAWQTGGGAFTVSPKDVDLIKHYIDKQPEHHSGPSSPDFVEEYRDLVLSAGLRYDGRYALHHPLVWHG